MSDSSSVPVVYPIPRNYQLINFLGSGGFGMVVMCKKKDTGERVAIKFSSHVKYATREVG